METELSLTGLMEQANTKEMRDELLKRFFKTALAAVSVALSTLPLLLSSNDLVFSKIRIFIQGPKQVKVRFQLFQKY